MMKQDMNASNIGQPIDAPINPITAEPLVKGQVTAIVTGVISVLIAVGYLVLVQVMDSRDMVPPVEEEAYGDGSVPSKVVVSAAESKDKNTKNKLVSLELFCLILFLFDLLIILLPFQDISIIIIVNAIAIPI